MKYLPAADYARTRWKNGAGETSQIAVFPSDATLDDFVWRVSMATVARDGAFSRFAGIDRTLIVLAGDGVILRLDGQEYPLLPGHAPFRFAADRDADAVLLGDVVTDLNIMTRRGAAEHRVAWVRPGESLAASAATVILFATEPSTLRILGERVALATSDAMIFGGGEQAALETGRVLAVSIEVTA